MAAMRFPSSAAGHELGGSFLTFTDTASERSCHVAGLLLAALCSSRRLRRNVGALRGLIVRATGLLIPASRIGPTE